MRKFLDGLYWLSGMLAGCLIIAICLLISAQILLNGATRMFGPILPSTIPSYADFSGYMLAGARPQSTVRDANEKEGATILVNVVMPQGSDGAHLPGPWACKPMDRGNYNRGEIHKGEL